MNLLNQIYLIARLVFRNIVKKPIKTIQYIINPSVLINHSSYYPDQHPKGRLSVFFDQLEQIWKFGYPNYYYFSYGFDVKSRKDIKEYLHYAPFMSLRDKLNYKPHSGTAILRDKLLFGFFTNSLGIDSGKNIGVIKGLESFSLETKKDVSTYDFIQSLKGDIIFKPIDGECGSGIFIINKKEELFYIQGNKISINELIEKLGNDRYLVQEVVKQHPKMSQLHPESLNTMRFVTIRDINSGKIIPFPSILRIGTGNSFVDNTSQGGLAVAVNINTGQLGDFGFYKPEYGTKVDTHPNSGIKFSEFTIPFFNKAKEQAIRLHSMLPNVQSIGWDIAIGENGPVFIEGNDNWEINGPQICNGPLKKQFYRLCKKYI